MIKKIKAWAILNKEGTIPENDDSPQFLCVHKTKEKAVGATLVDKGEKVYRCEIIIDLK